MSGPQLEDPAVEETTIARSLRLSGPLPPVTRLSRRALGVSAAVLVVAIAGSVTWSLAQKRKPLAPEETPVVAAMPPERVTAQPRDYVGRADAPVLGPPLPGDLGRPIVSSQQSRAAMEALPPAATPADRPSANAARPGVDRAEARGSALFAGSAPIRPSTPAAVATPSDKLAGPDPRMVSPERLSGPSSSYTLLAGAVIPAALVTALRSDLPGVAMAQVERDVFDSLGRGVRLVPAGARLIGTYDSQVASGASRLRVQWTRLVLPNGRSIPLDDLPAANAQGMAGLQDGVDRHGRALAGAAALSTLLALGAEAGASEEESDLARALRRGGGRAVTEVGQQAVAKTLAQPPVLTVRAGAPLIAVLTRDLILEPYLEPDAP